MPPDKRLAAERLSEPRRAARGLFLRRDRQLAMTPGRLSSKVQDLRVERQQPGQPVLVKPLVGSEDEDPAHELRTDIRTQRIIGTAAPS
jgi:hypothetical protein